ncbi:MAG: GWxTD domain-containing protein [Bacteroidota bacterium]
MEYHEFFVDRPGDYRVDVAFTDRNTDKTTYYQKYVSVLDFSDENSEVELSDPVLFIKSEEFGIETVKHYNIPAYFDSLSLNYTILNKSEELIITTTLSKFVSDSSFSRPLPFNNYSQSDLEFKGIDYSKPRVIQTIRRRLFENPGPIIFELNFTDLARGNYRAEVSVELASGREIKNQKVDFGIVGPNFPYVRSPLDLAEPLGLLMSEKDHKKLMDIKDPDRLKNAVDTYWLKNISTKQRAKDTILLFYERVEEANKLFSTYKEGWKTDQGMIYILFGRPFLIRRNLDRLQWSYTTNLYDNQSNFFFIRPNTKSIHFGFDNYLVERSQFYYQLYYQQIRAWETGVILFDTL